MIALQRAAAVFAVALNLALVAASCGIPKPDPVVPPGQTSCTEACPAVERAHHANGSSCGTSEELCLRLCKNVARNNPKYPTCLSRAAAADGDQCTALDDCDAETQDGDAGPTGR